MNKFGFNHTPREEKELVVTPIKMVRDNPNNDEVFNLIFAPDPVTGWPCSSLAVFVKSQNSDVKEFIKQHFIKDKGIGYDGLVDPDLALDGVKTSHESPDDYLKRLFEAAEREQIKLDTNDKK